MYVITWLTRCKGRYIPESKTFQSTPESKARICFVFQYGLYPESGELALIWRQLTRAEKTGPALPDPPRRLTERMR
eukprot:1363608-Rhodomonas_salina.2